MLSDKKFILHDYFPLHKRVLKNGFSKNLTFKKHIFHPKLLPLYGSKE